MDKISKKWDTLPALTIQAEESLSNFPQPLRQILFNRGYSTEESALNYLAASLPADSESNNLLGIEEAVSRITSAINNKEKIVVYGDYDADGVTATALLLQVLTSLGADAEYYIPHRFDEGYGLHKEALHQLYQSGVDVVITVDCGIRSLEEASYANDLGLDLIITDHHSPSKELPPALAIINPKRPDEQYSYKELAGVGVAYKLAKSLLTHSKKTNIDESDRVREFDLLDLVALGTVADLAPLITENRNFVRNGLKSIQKTRRQGLHSLILAASLLPEEITAVDIAMRIGPRINAAGRIGTATMAVDLLTTHDVNTAGRLAQKIDDLNRQRQVLTREIQSEAERIAFEDYPDPLLLFAADPGFNAGVVGLAASRLSEKYYRPAIVAHQGEMFTRGSCRSIPEFHITQALDECEDLLERHGGHAAAAGFTLKNDNLDAFVSRLRDITTEQLAGEDLSPVLQADLEIQLSDLTPEVNIMLDNLEPTGYGNLKPVFISREVKKNYTRVVGKDRKHLKLTVTDGVITYDAIAFGMGHLQQELPDIIDLMYTFELNKYNGKETLQLKIIDIDY